MNDSTRSRHRQAWDLIPWVVNATATPAERELVEQHLNQCGDCRDEYALQSRMCAGLNEELGSHEDPHPALRRLLARIDAAEGDEAEAIDLASASTAKGGGHFDRRGAASAPGGRWARVLVAAVVVQAIAIATLGVVLLTRTADANRGLTAASHAPYQTLSQPAGVPEPATIRFVPAPSMTMKTLQAMLSNSGLHIVQSNPDSSIYGLAATHRAASDQETMRVVTRLRARPDVLLAEPITAMPAPER